ncbi:hypothetical protein [Blastococcus sp. SYSU D00820]
MPWWGWLLVAWLPIAIAVAVVVGRGVAYADARETPQRQAPPTEPRAAQPRVTPLGAAARRPRHPV